MPETTSHCHAPSGFYRVGLATADITPPVGTALAGYAHRGAKPSRGIYHPLRAVAVAFSDHAQSMLLLSAEWIGFHDRAETMRQRIAEATGLDPWRVILLGTHTHCGPTLRESDEIAHGPINRAYLERAMRNMTECAQEAWARRTPARLRFGNGHCDLAVSRRRPVPDEDGNIQFLMRPNPHGPTDPEVGILVIESPSGDPRGVLFNYACHPTSRAGLLLGGDFVASACDAIEAAHPGAIACFLQGCAGDQKPRPPLADAEEFSERTVDEICVLGTQLADSVLNVLRRDALTPVGGELRVGCEHITLETEPVDMAAVQQGLDPDQPSYVRGWASHYKALLDRGDTIDRTVPFEVQTVRFGDSLVMVSFSAEMTVEHGLRLKSDLMPCFQRVMPLAYANHVRGYLPVQRQLLEGGYEVWESMLRGLYTGRYVPETEDRIHRTVQALVESQVQAEDV